MPWFALIDNHGYGCPGRVPTISAASIEGHRDRGTERAAVPEVAAGPGRCELPPRLADASAARQTPQGRRPAPTRRRGPARPEADAVVRLG